MKKQLKKKPLQSRFILEELEARQLFSGGIEGLVDTSLANSATITYLDIEANSGQKSAAETGITPISAAEIQTQVIVFVDSGVKNYQSLVDDILNNANNHHNIEVVLLNANQNGIDQISETLRDRDNLDAIHIISHGNDGTIQLGNTSLNTETLAENNLSIALWGNAFNETGDILLYGCNLAATEVGQSLINDLSELTLTDVAASDDLTGNATLGGNWELEYSKGRIETKIVVSAAAQDQFQAVLVDTILESYDPASTDKIYEIKSSQPWGQSFSYNSPDATYEVNKLEIKLSKATDAPSGQTITVTIRDSFNGTILGSANLSIDNISTTEGWHSFDFGSITLNDSTAYAIEVENSGSTTGKIYLGVASIGSYANGTFIKTDGSSEPSEDAAFKIIHSNSAPLLSGSNNLTTINEDPASNPGTLVSDLISGQVTDANSIAVFGIAVVAVDNTNGSWQYTTDSGSNWFGFGAVDDSSARLLASNASTFVRFVPDANWNGIVTNGITFHAWDQTSGTAGGTTNLTSTLTVRDEFNTNSFAGNDGTANWVGNWQELGESNGSGVGVVEADGTPAALQIGADTVDISGIGISREADLSGAGSATLSFEYWESHYDRVLQAGAGVHLEVSADGGSNWTTLHDYVLDNSLPNSATLTSFDISAYIGATTQIRFIGTGQVDSFFNADNIQIEYTSTTGTGFDTAFSVATASSSITVDPINDAPLGVPTITGTVTEDQILTADTSGISDDDGLTAFSYQWVRDGSNISGANSSTYTLDDADVGALISVQVTYTDVDGTNETLNSVQTSAVVNVNDTPTGLPLITGTATEDQTLTADTSGISDGDGVGTFSFQWFHNGIAIGGATASTHVLGDADVGALISVEVSYTDDEGTVEGPFTSLQTAAVTNINDAAIIAGADTGSVQEDISVVANNISTSGLLTITDVDNGESSFVAETIVGVYGSLTIDAAGNWSYSADNTQAAIQQLDLGESVTDTLTLTSFDGTTHNLIITINGTDDASVISGTTTGLVTEDGTLTSSGALVISDTDINDSTSFVDVAASASDNGFGTFEITANTWTFVLNNAHASVQALDVSETLTDSYTFTAPDGVTQQVTVTINGAEDAPVFSSAAVTAATEDSVYSYTITTSDVDIEAVSITATTLPAWLAFTDNGDGTATLSGTPTNAEVGNHAVVLNVSDGSLSSNQSFTISVANTNDAPVTTAVTLSSIIEDSGPRLISQAELLSNASDDDLDDVLSATGLTINSGSGALINNGDGSWTYTPDLNDASSVSFGYNITDGIAIIANTASLDIIAVNDIPVANPDSYITNEDTPLNNIDVLTNDTDVEADPLTVISASALNGSVTINPDGTLNYSPNTDFNGNDTIFYSIDDGNGGNATSTVAITVNPVVDAFNDSLITNEDEAATLNVLANDSFGVGAVVSSVTAGGNGSVTFMPDGTITYTPANNFNGVDTFSYSVTTALGDVETATVSVTINPVADAVNLNVKTIQNYPVNFVNLVNDSYGAGARISNVSQATNGQVVIETNGTVSYIPDTGFIGSDQFSYTVTDAQGNTETAIISIDVQQNITAPEVEIPSVDTYTLNTANEIVPAIQPASTLFAGDQNDGQNPLQESGGAGEESESEDDLSNIDDLINDTQNEESAVNTTQSTSTESEISVKQKININQPFVKPAKLVELLQIQAFQDQLSNQGLLSDIDMQIDVTEENKLWDIINEMHRQIDNDLSGDQEYQVEVQIALGSSVGLTAGFVSWVLRGGSLLASMLSAIPLLSRFDPLPVLKSRSDDEKAPVDDEDDTLIENEDVVNEIFS